MTTRQERVNKVAAAVADGRIPASRRAFWLAQLRSNPTSAAQTLDALTPARPTAELGWFN